MIIVKKNMTKQELKETVKKHLSEISNLTVGTKVKHRSAGYIAIVEKVFKNGRIDFKVIEENGKPTTWYFAHRVNITKFTDALYTFEECFEIVN